MFESALLIRWMISILVIILLIAAFYVLLKIIKEKGVSLDKKVSNGKMRVIDQCFLDSKNKLVKVQDGNKVITIVLGQNASLISEEKVILEEKVEEKSDV